jgi:exosortase/archaeosortase family protein
MTELVGSAWLYGARRPSPPARLRLLWAQAPPRGRTAVQLALLLGSVVGAYSYSLTTLFQNAGLETPLAYVSLVPVISLALAALRRHPVKPEPAIHDRQVDYIVGVPLVALALGVNLWLPNKLSAMFWVWRLDLFSLPFFVAGAVAIIFGTRIMWRQKLAIGYLMLAWPLPYTLVLLGLLNGFTNLTLAGLHAVLHVVPVATPASSSDSSVFSVVHAGRSFPLSVVSACSGVNGIVGFLLIGVAFGAVVTGPFLRKALWLAGGMVLLWCTNLGRLLFIFWAGRQWGEHIAIDVLHPFVGLLTFSLGVLAMVLVLGRLGLHIGTPAPAGGEAPTATARPRPLAVPRFAAAALLVAVAALVLGLADTGLRSYNLVADASGEPKLAGYLTLPLAPDGWKSRLDNVFDWAKPLFGDDSTWYRYILLPGGGGDLRAAYGVTLDVIDTGDLQSFSAYGVEACYQFHGYSLRDVSEAKLAGGISGQTLSFTAGPHQSWSIVYWIVPVKAGQSIRYERMVLYLLNAPGGSGVTLPRDVRIRNLAGSLGTSPVDRELEANRTFLVAFADELLRAQARPSPRLVAAAQQGGVPAALAGAASPLSASPGLSQSALEANDAPPGSRPRDSAVVSLAPSTSPSAK